MISKKKEYPEDIKWDDSDTYTWKGEYFIQEEVVLGSLLCRVMFVSEI